MINKPRATADEGNQLKSSNSVQARRLSSVLPPEACTSPMWIGLFTPPNRFQVITVGCENDAFEPDEKLTYPPIGRMGQQSRLSVPDFLAVVVPGRRKTSTLSVQENTD
ncbi:hypothetical protein AVEN_160149-1, partial [Araneus ventricosus]